MKPRMKCRTEILRIVFALALLFFPASAALALCGNTESSFGLDGSLRTVAAAVRNYDFSPLFGPDNEEDEYSQTLLRLTAAGRPSDNLAYQVHLVQSLTTFSGQGGNSFGAFNLSGNRTRYRALDDSWDWLSGEHNTAGLWLDRFNVRISFPNADLTLGRQAVTFGKAYFWNPLDVYLPFDPRQFDRDYKAGVDAVRLDVPLGFFSGINLVAVFGREIFSDGSSTDGQRFLEADWKGSSLLARFFTNAAGWDLAVQGGKIYGGWQIGGGLVGELFGLEIRAEAALFWAEDSPDMPFPYQGQVYENSFTAVLGLGRRFENSLTVEAEYLYNGAGSENLNESMVRSASGGLLHLGRHLAGLTVAYDILPILVGRLAMIHSFTDASTQIQPTLTWSAADNAEVIAGASLNYGERPATNNSGLTDIRSELGLNPDYYFAEFKIYF